MEKVIIQKYLSVATFVIALVTLSVFCFSNPGFSLDQKENIYYTCPMPEHADVVMDKPGKCPKCGMNLVKRKTTATIKYVCPMKEDADVVMDKPGKCPKCGMKLVPKLMERN